jgi:hypothetical protein
MPCRSSTLLHIQVAEWGQQLGEALRSQATELHLSEDEDSVHSTSDSATGSRGVDEIHDAHDAASSPPPCEVQGEVPLTSSSLVHDSKNINSQVEDFKGLVVNRRQGRTGRGNGNVGDLSALHFAFTLTLHRLVKRTSRCPKTLTYI